MLSRSELLSSATAFCDAFVQKKDLNTILSFFSSTSPVSAIEHGEKALVPTIGRVFNGIDGVRSYFVNAFTLLDFQEMSFSEYTVDTEPRKVGCQGLAKLAWRETGERWDELFLFLLDFDNEGKITKYQLWGDSGSMYLAKIGKLDEVREGGGDKAN